MADIRSKEKVLKMRKHGQSITQIAKETGKSKSTVNYWCRDVQLTKEQQNRLSSSRGKAGLEKLLELAENKRRNRVVQTEKQKRYGKVDVGMMGRRDLFMVGLALYWGEGYKKGNEECGFTNSDPDIIRVIIKWFKQIYGITNEQFTLRVSVNSVHESREKEIVNYWEEVTKLPRDQFTATSFIKTKPRKVYNNGSEHYGTLRIKVKNGANLRRRILGSISALGDV